MVDLLVPIRFAKIESIDDTDDRVVLGVKLGPFICTEDPSCHSKLWGRRDDVDRPGRRFLFEDENPGLFGPTSDVELDNAWRRIVDAVGSGYLEKSTFARITGIFDSDGIELDPADPVRVGQVVELELELRTPASDADEIAARVEAFTDGAVVPVIPDQQVPATGVARLPIRAELPGEYIVRIGLGPTPALSCRPEVRLSSVPMPTPLAVEAFGSVAPSTAAAPNVDGDQLIQFLEREASLDDAAWVRLLDGPLRQVMNSSRRARSACARHAAAIGDYRRAYEELLRLDERRPDESLMLLEAALRLGETDVIPDLVHEAEIESEAALVAIERAAPHAPEGSVDALLGAVIDADALGDTTFARLVERLGSHVRSSDLVCKIADKLVYIFPEAGARLLMDRWEPARMPRVALDMLLDWDVERDRLVPYRQHALGVAVQASDVERIRQIAEAVRNMGPTIARAALMGSATEALLIVGHSNSKALAAAMLYDAVSDAATLGQLDLATELLDSLRAARELKGVALDQHQLERLEKVVLGGIEADDRFSQWRRFQDQTLYDELRPKLTNKVLHLVGGRRAAWVDELQRGLGVARLQWHKQAKDESPNLDWALGLGTDDVVVTTKWIGHATSEPLSSLCRNRGVPYGHASGGKRSVLEKLGEILG